MRRKGVTAVSEDTSRRTEAVTADESGLLSAVQTAFADSIAVRRRRQRDRHLARPVVGLPGDAPLPVRLHAVRLEVRIVHPPRPGHVPASHRERTVAHDQVPEGSLRSIIGRWQWGESKFLQKLVMFRR